MNVFIGMKVQEASHSDLEPLLKMSKLLWPEYSDPELTESIIETFEHDHEITFIVKTNENDNAGFAMLSLRSDYVEGSSSRPVGYLEAIFVYPQFRKTGIAKELVRFGEKWCLQKGCSQMGSDTDISNLQSQKFHINSDFKEVGRNVCFIKDL